MTSAEKYMQRLQKAPLSSNVEEYTEMCQSVDKENYIRIIELIVRNYDDKDSFCKIVLSFLKGMTKNPKQFDMSQISRIIGEQMTTNVSLYILEYFYKTLSDLDKDELIRCVCKEGVETSTLIHLLTPDTVTLVKDILNTGEEGTVTMFIRDALVSLDSDLKIAKALGMLLPQLKTTYFINYKPYEVLLSYDNHHLRCCFLEISENLIMMYKSSDNVEAIEYLTSLITECLSDTNIYVRAKAVTVLSQLFRNAAILTNQKLEIIEGIIGRLHDKTVLVRKKAISILGQIILNYDLANEDSRLLTMINKALAMSLELLDTNAIKTDITDVFTLFKIAYLRNISGSKECVEKMLNFIFQEEYKTLVVETFNEITESKKSVLFEFFDNRAFEETIQYITIDHLKLMRNLKEQKNVYESIYVLHVMKKYKISEGASMALINFATDIVFATKSLSDLNKNIIMYNHVLKILQHLNERIDHDHEIFKLLINNVIKMTFYECNIIPNTVELIYKISRGPDINSVRLLRNISKSGSSIKMLDAIGTVAMNQYKFIEIIERRIKGDVLNPGVNSSILTSNTSVVSERITAKKRLSTKAEKNTESSTEKLPKRMRRNSLLDSTTVKYTEIQKSLSSKNEEEITDFFDYLKENEVLFSSEGMLHQLTEFLTASCIFKDQDPSFNEDVFHTANVALCKCMLISMRMFDENFEGIFVENLLNENVPSSVRNTLITFLNDLIIYYGSFIDTDIIFKLLEDDSTKRNALLVIYNLIQKNILRLKKHGRKILRYLEDEEIGNIVKLMVKDAADKQSIANLLFYECFLADELDSDHLTYVGQFVANQSDKIKMIEKCSKTAQSKRQREKLEIAKEILKVDKLIEEGKKAKQTDENTKPDKKEPVTE